MGCFQWAEMLPWPHGLGMHYFLWVEMLPWSHGLVMHCFLWAVVLSWVHGPAMCCGGLEMACFGAVFISGVTSLVTSLLVLS